MAIAVKQIMLITRNVQFAIDVKRALEALGEYGVTTVAEVRNAIEALHDQPQDLILLDSAGLNLSPAILIEMIRSRQEDIAIVLAPDNPAMRELAVAYQLRGVVDVPVMARTLIPFLDDPLEAVPASPLQTQPAPPDDLDEDTAAIESLVDELMGDQANPNYTRWRLQASYQLLNPTAATSEASSTQKLAELLIEPGDEGDTVRYRYINDDNEENETPTTPGLHSLTNDDTPVASSDQDETVRDLAQSLLGEGATEQEPPNEPQNEAASHAAAEPDLENSEAFTQLLNTVIDESTLLEDLKMESLFDTTRELSNAIDKETALPKWLLESHKFFGETSIEPEILPPLDAAPADEATTSRSAKVDSPNDLLQTLEETEESRTSEAEPPGRDGASWGLLSSREQDPVLAQLALTITQMMSGLTADATLLTRDNRIVAFSGALPLEDFRSLRELIGDDWTAKRNHSRIRFLKLPQNRKDYLLYSRGTVADATLTMIFAGSKQLCEIRRQGDRMASALAVPPQNEALAIAAEQEAELLTSEEKNLRQPFAFVWMLADPAQLLNKKVAEQLVFWLEVQLNSLNWKVHRLDVHQDFIYLYADAPADASPEALVRNVMERSRIIACSEDKALPQKLWADAYLVLQPGREMNEGELQRFLQFARA